jgi:tetratricopeptide (TPR) repeat protein
VRVRSSLPLALVVLASLAVHGRAIGFGFSYLDDDVLILDQQETLAPPAGALRAFAPPYFPPSGRDHAYYRPLVTASYAVDAAWSGTSPRGYHLTNVLLGALAAGLLFLLLRRLGHGDGIALFGGLVYAVHPALTEAVAWIPGRNDTLLVVFSLAAWLLLFRAREKNSSASKLAHLGAWLAALLCKETALVLPLVWAAHLLLVDRRPPRKVAAPWLLGGWAIVLALYLAARAVVLPDRLGAAGVSAAAWANISVVASSLGKIVLPARLSVLATPEDSALWPGAVAACALIAAWFVPGVRRAHLLFAVVSFVAFIVPGLPASRMLALENRLALPAIAIVILAAEVANHLSWPPRASLAAGGVLVAALAAITVWYAGDFRDRLTFAQAAVRGSPHAAIAHRNLGITYHLAGQTALARQEYEAAIAEDTAEPVVHNNLAVLLMAEGRLPQAEVELRAELAVNPRYAPAHANLARVLGALGRAGEATKEQALADQLGPSP